MTARKRERPAAPSPVAEAQDAVDEALEQLLVEVGRETQPQPQPTFHSLRGMCAIITGGATGIGRATAFELAEHGVHIAFNYIDDGDGRTHTAAETTAEALEQLGVRVFARSCDVRQTEAVDTFVADAREELGGLHILVNNAGIARDRALWHMTDDQWREVIETNLSGAFHMIRAVTDTLREQQFGKIVNISSIHGLHSEFGLANYSASKAGLLGLTRSAALELGPSNINVNAVAPGYIRTTRLAEAVPAEVLDRARERTVLARLGDPSDVAHVVAFLCSELARHITGAVIPVDGGHLL